MSGPKKVTEGSLDDKVRTQVSLARRQRLWAKRVAELASWRLENDPVYTEATGKSVSMAEVVRVALDYQIRLPIASDAPAPTVDEIMEAVDQGEHGPMGYDPSEYPFLPDSDDLRDGRRMEIVAAMEDVARYGELTGNTSPMEEVPDGRTQLEDTADDN
jgi:hypothetical protein